MKPIRTILLGITLGLLLSVWVCAETVTIIVGINQPIKFSVIATDADGTIKTKKVYFGDGFETTLTDSTTSHYYETTGIYKVVAEVEDDKGGISYDTLILELKENQLPEVKIDLINESGR